MEKNLRVEVKRHELVELASRYLKREVTTLNIKAVFRGTRIWPLNYNAFMDGRGYSREFFVDV